MERQEPARSASFVADVGVPLAQASISGGILSGLLAWGLHELAPAASVDLGRFFLFWWLVLGGAVWFVVLVDGRRLLWRLERWVARDIDQDGQIGEPAERVVVVGVPQAQEKAQERAQQATQSQFRSFVAGLPIRGTSLRAWEKDIGRERYTQYRDVLLRMRWAQWRSVGANGRPRERQGWALTVPVDDILSKVAD